MSISNRVRALVLAVIVCLAGMGAYVAARGTVSAPESAVATVSYPIGDRAPADVVTEDMPAWDCRSMGNGVCGPVPECQAYRPTVRALCAMLAAMPARVEIHADSTNEIPAGRALVAECQADNPNERDAAQCFRAWLPVGA